MVKGKGKGKSAGSGMLPSPPEEVDEWEESNMNFPKLWKPSQTGEWLIGEVKEKNEGFYGTYAIIELTYDCTITLNGELQNVEAGEKIQTPAHKNLQRLLENADVNDVVFIRYKGLQKTRTGRVMESYELRFKGAK